MMAMLAMMRLKTFDMASTNLLPRYLMIYWENFRTTAQTIRFTTRETRK
jgi:hypothetical protein